MSDSKKTSARRAKFSGQAVEVARGRKWTFEKRPGGIVLAVDPETGERKRVHWTESRGKLWANVAGDPFHGEWINSARAAAGAAADSDLSAQFPGKVRKLLVKEGASVAQGEPLILVEAMKMEFSVKAPSNGVIRKVLVKEGQQLNPGDRFFEFEESK